MGGVIVGSIGTPKWPLLLDWDTSWTVDSLDGIWEDAVVRAGIVRGDNGSVAILDIDAKLPLISRDNVRGERLSSLADENRTRPLGPEPVP